MELAPCTLSSNLTCSLFLPTAPPPQDAAVPMAYTLGPTHPQLRTCLVPQLDVNMYNSCPRTQLGTSQLRTGHDAGYAWGSSDRKGTYWHTGLCSLSVIGRYSPHRYSSSAFLQSETPSHRAVSSIHLKDEWHLYFPEQSKWTEEREGMGEWQQVAPSMHSTAPTARGISPVVLNLPINNETCIETTSPTAACFLQSYPVCPKFQGVGLPQPQYHYLRESQDGAVRLSGIQRWDETAWLGPTH